MGPQAGPEGQAVSRQGALLYFQNKEEAMASGKLRLSAPLEMGRMSWDQTRTPFSSFVFVQTWGPPASKVLDMQFPPPGPPPSRATGPLLGLSRASPLAKCHLSESSQQLQRSWRLKETKQLPRDHTAKEI